ncbi:MAG: AzlD domain-containing protein [Chloroflexi bacterium]|nr:AzlD domain-containing protein [Chloroflexota bacterium]
MNLWIIAFGMGLVTYGIRLSVLVFVHHTALPGAARDALRYVTPAVLTAIIVPAVLYVDGAGAFSPGPGNERVPAALLAAGVAWLTKSVWATIAAGMTALWLLQWAT